MVAIPLQNHSCGVKRIQLPLAWPFENLAPPPPPPPPRPHLPCTGGRGQDANSSSFSWLVRAHAASQLVINWQLASQLTYIYMQSQYIEYLQQDFKKRTTVKVTYAMVKYNSLFIHFFIHTVMGGKPASQLFVYHCFYRHSPCIGFSLSRRSRFHNFVILSSHLTTYLSIPNLFLLFAFQLASYIMLYQKPCHVSTPLDTAY